MHIKLKSYLAVLICVLMVFLTACSDEAGTKKINLYTQDATHQKAISLPQEPRFNKLLDNDGKINKDYLVPATSTVIKKNYDNRVYIEYNEKTFFYNPVYISYEQILNNKNISLENKSAVLEEAFSKAKSCGFKTVALYVDWKSFYNGEKYNYDFYKIYYKLAEKYDLYVSIIWLGYSKNGFMPWQVEREKYPELQADKEQIKVSIPDLSQQIYIDEACDALDQFCAWLNYIDFNKRTVLIQLEDEAGTNFGFGAWLSQFSNYTNLLLKMAETIKKSAYNVVTTVGVTFDDYKLELEGLTGRERLDTFLNSEYIDGMGAANLTTPDFNVGTFANDEKFCYISKLSPATYDFFQYSLSCLSQGYSFGVYELKSFDLNINCGIYRTHSTRWDVRNKELVDRGILAKKRLYESNTNDIIDFIKSINSLGGVLAYTSIYDIISLNPGVYNNYIFSHKINKLAIDVNKVSDIALSFNNSVNPGFTYNSAGIAVIDPYSNLYVFAFHGSPALAVDCNYDVSFEKGTFIDDQWVASYEPIPVPDHRFIMQSGVVYKIVLEDNKIVLK